MKSLFMTLVVVSLAVPMKARSEEAGAGVPDQGMAALAQPTTQASIDPEEDLSKLDSEQLTRVLVARETTAQQKLKSPQVDVLAVGGFFATVIVVVALAIFISLRKIRMRHETIRLMLEKGVTPSPDLLEPAKKPSSQLNLGLTFLAVGLGLTIYFAVVADGSGTWAIGMVPTLLGVAKLVVWKVESKSGVSAPANSHSVFP